MAKKHKHPEHVNHERWLVSYADFITLLFAFFVVMFSVSQVDSNKVGKFSESFSEAMGVHVLSGSTGIFEPGGSNSPFQMTPRSGLKAPPESLNTTLASVEGKLQAAQERAQQRLLEMTKEKGDGKGKGKEQGKGQGKGQGAEKKNEGAILGLRILRRRTELVLRLDLDVLFESGSDIIETDAQNTVKLIAETLREQPITIRVEGHTDDVPISTAQFRSNWHLSTARATAMIQFFHDNGIDPKKLSAAGYAEWQPIASNATAEGRAKNRRVDIVVGAAAEPETRATGTDSAKQGDQAHGQQL